MDVSWTPLGRTVHLAIYTERQHVLHHDQLLTISYYYQVRYLKYTQTAATPVDWLHGHMHDRSLSSGSLLSRDHVVPESCTSRSS